METTRTTTRNGIARVTCTCGFRSTSLRPSTAAIVEAGHKVWHDEHPGEAYPKVQVGRRSSARSR